MENKELNKKISKIVRTELLLGFLILLFGISTLVSGYTLNEFYGSQINNNIKNSNIQLILTKSEVTNPNQCSTESLSSSAYCLRDYISTFYDYQIREDTEKTLEDISENGGDCYDYTKLYNKLFTRLGYQTKEVTLYDKKETVGHTALVVWNDNLTEYCNIDMLKVNCFYLQE